MQHNPPDRRRPVLLLVIAAFHVLAVTFIVIGQLWTGPALAMVIFAYSRGLLHATDADHLAMIDGSTRKLLGENRNPKGVGLAFSLGHSTVVMAAGIAVVAGAGWVRDAIDEGSALAVVLGSIGASVSAVYLLAVASANVPLLVAAVRGGQAAGHAEPPRGWMSRALAAPLARVRHAGHVYVFGVLFGLGFDTASTISLLMLTAAGAVAGVPFISLLALPLAFTAAMTLGDSTNSEIMRRVYTAADTAARRTLNIALLAVSILSAVAVAAVTLTELAGVWTGVAVPEIDTTLWGWALAALAFVGGAWLALPWGRSAGRWQSVVVAGGVVDQEPVAVGDVGGREVGNLVAPTDDGGGGGCGPPVRTPAPTPPTPPPRRGVRPAAPPGSTSR